MKDSSVDITIEKYSQTVDSTDMKNSSKVDTTVEKYNQTADSGSKLFNLKPSWVKKTSMLSNQLDGKHFTEVLRTLLEIFDEFREEAKSQVPSDKIGVGVGILRLLDQSRQFIRSFELIEEQIKFPSDMDYLGINDDIITDERLKKKKSEGKKQITIGKVKEKVSNLMRTDDSPSKNYYNETPKAIEQVDIVHKEQIQLIIQGISDLMGIIDEVFPAFIPKPAPKKDIPIDSLEVFQNLLKIALQQDDVRLAREMRSQREVIDSLLGQYDISVVCFEDEITPDQKVAWFEEKLVNPKQSLTTKTLSPALVRSGNAILLGIVSVPNVPLEKS